jgi:hypothetical protein
MKVLLKVDWLKAKEEMRSIKTEIARLTLRVCFNRLKLESLGNLGLNDMDSTVKMALSLESRT